MGKKSKFNKPSRVCVWTEHDLAYYMSTACKPSCRNHEHVDKFEAAHLTGAIVSEWFDPEKKKWKAVTDSRWVHLEPHFMQVDPEFPKFSAIIENDPRVWGIAKSDGVETHQRLRAGK